MNTEHRKPLPGTGLDYFDTREAIEAIQPGSYDKLPYTSRVLAEQLVRRCEPEALTASLKQIIERKRDLDFPWYPARVVCHDILGQTALVDLAGLRDAIAEQGGDPAVDLAAGMIAGQSQWHGNVIGHGLGHQQIEMLEDHPDALAEAPQTIGVQGGHVFAIDQDAPAGRFLEPID